MSVSESVGGPRAGTPVTPVGDARPPDFNFSKELKTRTRGYLIVTRSALAIAGVKAQQFTNLKVETIFNFYRPRPPLSKFVDSLWLYQGDGAGHKIERILPTGTLELAINLRENELGFYDAERPENCSRFSGAVVVESVEGRRNGETLDARAFRAP